MEDLKISDGHPDGVFPPHPSVVGRTSVLHHRLSPGFSFSSFSCSNDWNFVLLSVVPLVTQMVKNLPVTWETQVRSLGQEAPLEKGMATHCTLAWRIPRTEEPGGLQSMGSQRGRHD